MVLHYMWMDILELSKIVVLPYETHYTKHLQKVIAFHKHVQRLKTVFNKLPKYKYLRYKYLHLLSILLLLNPHALK